MAQITLLGVQAPDLDREKATTPGRDVHLPTEVRRVAAPRAIAADAASPSPSRDRRKTPESPRPRVTSATVPSIPLETRDVMSSVNARLSETGEVPNAAVRSARRPDFAETTLMDAVPETGRGGAVALGIVISLVAAVVVVWTMRFGPHLRAFETAATERPWPSSEPGRLRQGVAPPSREPRLPAPPGAPSPAAEGEPSGSNAVAAPAPRGLPSPEDTTAARGTPLGDGPPAAAPGATEDDGRRKNQRPRTSASGDRIGERNGSSAAASRRAAPPPIFRGGDAPGQVPTSLPPVGSGRAASAEPPRFEPPPPPPPPAAATPARPAPTNEKPAYDPDSPLPPAAGE